jgi:imidazolonepropionase-like amidohydrolase
MFRIDGCRVFDGRSVIEAACVEVDGETISFVGPAGGSGQPAARTVDGRGRTLLPGLIDAHTHTYGSLDNLELALRFGVTTELDLFLFPPELTRKLCDAAADRTDLADLRSAGCVASPAGGLPGIRMPDLPVLGIGDDPERFVADRVAEGAHFLKIIIDDGGAHGARLPVLGPAMVAGLARAARDRGLVSIAHVSSADSVRVAIDGGVDTLTHLPLEAILDDRLVGRMAAGGHAVMPTLAILELGLVPGRGRALATDPRIAARLTPAARAALTTGSEGLPVTRPTPAMDFGHATASTAKLAAAGVPVLAGSDANNAPGRDCPAVHGVTLHAELALLVDAGLTPSAALAAATSAPAERFRLTDRGVIETGRRADLLLVRGDPATDILATRAIEAVWRQGHLAPGSPEGGSR